MIDTQCKSNINTPFGEHFPSENRNSSITVNDKILKYDQSSLKPSNTLKLLKK